MDELQKAREQINEIDEQMAELFQKRMRAVESVIAFKKQHGMPVLDASREEEVIAKNTAKLKDETYKEFYHMFIRDVMRISRSYQKSVLYHDIVGYAGTAGAFSNLAAKRLFPDAVQQAYPGFEDIFQAVVNDEIRYGIIPFENSYTGEVGEVLDLLLEYDVHITSLYDMPIRQNLLGIKGSSLKDIRQIYSKDQAISQCYQFLRGRDIETVPYPNTALAAQYVAQQNDKTKAAIASKETAELFGLEILEEDIQTSEDNTTRFIVISKEIRNKGNRFNLLFTLPHSAGSLASVMQIIAEGSFNMESIKSRSLKKQPWKYYFYVEIVGNPFAEKECRLLKDLKEVCEEVRLLGCYDKESRDDI